MSGAAINLDILPNSSKSASKVNKEFSKEDMAGKILLHFKIRTCKKEDNPCSKFFFSRKSSIIIQNMMAQQILQY